MQPNAGFGHLDSLVDEIQKKQSDHVKLESQLRQQRHRAESEAAEASRLKSELEAAAVEKLSLQKRIGLLSRKNEDLAGENAKLLEEKCDFQRSMANNEAKLKENEMDLRAAQKNFVDKLDEANAAYSRNRAAMNTLLGRSGAGCAGIPSPEELDALKAAAAKAQQANLRAAEAEARMNAVVAESNALKGEAVESAQRQQALRQEVAALKDALQSGDGKSSNKTRGAEVVGTAPQQDTHQRVSWLEQEVARLHSVCGRQEGFMEQMDEYANTVEAQNAKLRQLLDDHGILMDNEHGGGGGGATGGAADSAQEDSMEGTDESPGGQDLAQPARKENDAVDLMPPPSQGGRG